MGAALQMCAEAHAKPDAVPGSPAALSYEMWTLPCYSEVFPWGSQVFFPLSISFCAWRFENSSLFSVSCVSPACLGEQPVLGAWPVCPLTSPLMTLGLKEVKCTDRPAAAAQLLTPSVHLLVFASTSSLLTVKVTTWQQALFMYVLYEYRALFHANLTCCLINTKFSQLCS